jgi:hypothetical protein
MNKFRSVMGLSDDSKESAAFACRSGPLEAQSLSAWQAAVVYRISRRRQQSTTNFKIVLAGGGKRTARSTGGVDQRPRAVARTGNREAR